MSNRNEPHFDGPDYHPEVDHRPLTTQLAATKELMVDGNWRTLEEIEEVTRHPQASVSARLRDLRKPKFGGYVVDRRMRKGTRTREYRVYEGAMG